MLWTELTCAPWSISRLGLEKSSSVPKTGDARPYAQNIFHYYFADQVTSQLNFCGFEVFGSDSHFLKRSALYLQHFHNTSLLPTSGNRLRVLSAIKKLSTEVHPLEVLTEAIRETISTFEALSSKNCWSPVGIRPEALENKKLERIKRCDQCERINFGLGIMLDLDIYGPWILF